jgi:RNA polymerase sigma-70 factor (ECF subfamily)
LVTKSENILIVGCINSQRTAQFQLFEQYKSAMFSTLYRMLGNYDDAQDVLQEGFVQVFKRIQDFKKQSTLGAWIKTIMVRQAIARLRKKQWLETVENLPDVAFSPPDSMLGEAIEAAILKIPEGCRAVFLMIEVEGYAHKEVAELLEISEGTSKSQLSYAKKLLRNLLKDER